MMYCDVKWGGKFSSKFSVRNGVRQGAVSSPLLFSVYIDDLFKLLRRSGLGCHITNVFFARFGYADDLLLLSASRSGLQELVKICEKFARSKGLKFGTDMDPVKSKTKCLIFSRKKVDTRNVAPIMLNDDPLPWVANVLQCDNKMSVDMDQKRGKLIGKLNSFSQEFHYVEPHVYVTILNIYASSFYSSWNVARRI